jgi:hypothetical protein
MRSRAAAAKQAQPALESPVLQTFCGDLQRCKIVNSVLGTGSAGFVEGLMPMRMRSSCNALHFRQRVLLKNWIMGWVLLSIICQRSHEFETAVVRLAIP